MKALRILFSSLGLVGVLLIGLAIAACAANTTNYMEQGGSRWVVGSGGTLEIESGGTFTLFGADRLPKVKKQALAAVATSGGVLSWANPTSGTIVIERLILDLTTQSGGASTIDCGVASGATTVSDNLIDGLSGATAGTFDNVENQGTNGVAAKKMTSSQYLTCSQASGDVTGLVGNAYIHYYAE